jgi:hypothetical protein
MEQETDRTRRHTAQAVLARIDSDTYDSLLRHADAGDAALSRRMEELDREWDIDRTVETEASLMALTGLALGATVNRKFYALPGFVASMVLLQAFTGWYPLLPLFRRLGVRTSGEINRERYALKALRGDFDNLDNSASEHVLPLGTSNGHPWNEAEVRINA